MNSTLVGIGCSFVRHSIDGENQERANIGKKVDHLNRKKIHKTNVSYPETETSFLIEAGEMLDMDTVNLSVGGAGNRYIVFKLFEYLKKTDLNNIIVLIGITDFTRFDFIRPSYLNPKWPKLDKYSYAPFYDKLDSAFEILSLYELLSTYLDSKKIKHLFINTMNMHISTKDLLPTFLFPNGSEYWRNYIKSYDSTYGANHPNIDDHQILGKLIVDHLNKKFI